MWVPDGAPLDVALARTTDLGIVAHQDDLEFMALAPIGACLDDPDRWFTGVACTDGVGSVRTGRYADVTDDEMAAVRRDEQRAAAEIGGYSAIVQLGHPEPVDPQRGGRRRLRPPGGRAGRDPGGARARSTSTPTTWPTSTRTHLAAGLATVEALRTAAARPASVAGGRHRGLAQPRLAGRRREGPARREPPTATSADRLAAVFVSQLEGGKRYDLAERGRRLANATLLEPRAVEEADEVTYAMDLTPLVRNDDLDPAAYVAAAIRRFQVDAEAAIAADPGLSSGPEVRRSSSSGGRRGSRAPSRGCRPCRCRAGSGDPRPASSPHHRAVSTRSTCPWANRATGAVGGAHRRR